MLDRYNLLLKKINNLDYFILPNNDEFFSEYLPEYRKRLQFITNFSGSNAIVIFTKNKPIFFTDGRYMEQVKNELDTNLYQIHNISDKTPIKWLSENIQPKEVIGFDPKLHNTYQIKLYKKTFKSKMVNFIALDTNPVDSIWNQEYYNKNNKIFPHYIKYAGINIKDKLDLITRNLESDNLFLGFPPSINWLLNIRGEDIKYTPIVLCLALIKKNKNVILFLHKNKINSQIEKYLGSSISLIDIKNIESYLTMNNINDVQIDDKYTNYWTYNIFKKANIRITNKEDPCLYHKSIKNQIEVNGAIKAHEIDGLAVTKFLFWIEESLNNNIKINEILAEDKLLEFRQKNKDFKYPSFNTISGFKSNGAIIHYCANKKTNKEFTGNSLYLVDSGGQYPYGTTDVTRTIAIGKAREDQIDSFTTVLKGHIAIAMAKFPLGTTGSQLDILARYHLWQSYKDYPHGTGHGVGSFLSVHESPPSISKNCNIILQENMILSNEPGYYVASDYGIRIENLLLVTKCLKNKSKNHFLQFKDLTLAPIDYNLIDFIKLNNDEKRWLFEYHQKIYKVYSNKLTIEENIWLKNILNIYKKNL